MTRVNPAVSLPLYPSYPAAYPAGRRKGGPGSSWGEAGTGGTARIPTITGGPGSRDYWGSSFPTIATIQNPSFSRIVTVPRHWPAHRIQTSVSTTKPTVHSPPALLAPRYCASLWMIHWGEGLVRAHWRERCRIYTHTHLAGQTSVAELSGPPQWWTS